MDVFKLFGVLSLLGVKEAKSGISDVTGHAGKNSVKFGNALKKMGDIAVKSFKIVGAAATAVGGYALKVGSDFEAGMSQVAAVSGAAGDELEALTEKAKEMGAKTKFSATESAEAFNYMAMAGWKTEDMLNGIEGVMNLAAASGENLGTVSDIVTDALTAMGLSASDSAHFADVLAAASSNSNTNVAMMGETFKYAAPLAGTLGYSIEDTAQAIGLMANAGIKGGQAGTSLRAILTRLASPASECATAMNKYGISLTNADGSMKSLGDVMSNMRTSLQGLSADEQAAAATAIGGQEALSGLLAIVNASDEDFDKLSSAIANADGKAQEMADTMNNNLKGKFTILKSAAEGFGISLYEAFSGKAQSAVETLTEYVSRLTEAFQKGGVSGLVDEFGAVFSDLLEKISSNAPEMINIGLQLIQSLGQGLIAAIPSLIPVAANLITTIATGLLNMLPAIAQAAVDILLALSSGISQSLPELIPTVVDVVLQIVTTLIENIDLLIDAAVDLISALAEGLIAALPILIMQAPTIISKLVQQLVAEEPRLLVAAADIILQLVTGIANNLFELGTSAGTIITTIVEGIGEMWGSIISVGSQVVDKIKEGISNAWQGLKNWFKGIWDGLFGGLKVNVGVSGGGGKPAASGLDYVPRNNYPALLHEGEAVLTASEAKAWRKGNGGAGNGVVINQYINAPTQTPVQLASATAAYFEQARWAL